MRDKCRAGLLFAVALGCLVAFAETEASNPQSDIEAWNAGVEYYRAGDVTNALQMLRPLMLTRSHGARAAEVIAAIEYERGELEEAAEAAQIALRADPSDARANRNFTRAIDRLPQLRQERHEMEVLQAAQGRDPGSLLQAATAESRELMRLCAVVATNAPADAIELSDAMARRAKELADVWLPVRQTIAQSVTNQEQAATIMTQIDNAQSRTKAAAVQLEDMDEAAYSSLADAEHDLTRFLKMTIMPPAAMAESEVAQSNAWQDVEAFNGRGWQQDALDFTRAFRARFPAWARAYEQQAQSDTNLPPFTADDQAKVSALATELEKLQIECTEKNLPPNQESALRIIRQIRELLPDNGKGGGQGQPQGQPQDNQDKQQPQSGPQPDPQQHPQPKEEPKQDPQENRDVESVLKKAQERSDEHEAEKRERARKAPLPKNARDW